jgi:hypothetical protein
MVEGRTEKEQAHGAKIDEWIVWEAEEEEDG